VYLCRTLCIVDEKAILVKRHRGNNSVTSNRGKTMDYDAIFKLIADVGFPIAAALVCGVFVYFVINYILESVLKAIKGMQGIIMGLDNRVKTMNHDIIRVDAVVSAALGLRPDLERIARADGKNDARKD